MKAIVYRTYGSPDVLETQDLDVPPIKDDEVLLRVHAVSANPADWHMMRGSPVIARIGKGLRTPTEISLGVDVAGEIEAVGQRVTQFRPGDAVFGERFQVAGSGFAEYVAMAEDRIVPKPAGVTFEVAAAVPLAAMTALQGLRDKGGIQSGQRVLINGASGGVGTFAVQIAKWFGAEVTGVCSTRNLELVGSIGARDVIDYTREDFTRSGKRYDLVLCTVGNRTAADYRRLLAPNGRAVVSGFTTMPHMIGQVALLGSLVSLGGNGKVGMMGTVRPNKTDLVFLRDLLEEGSIVPVIDRRYPLPETAEAIRYLEEGHARGKVVVTV